MNKTKVLFKIFFILTFSCIVFGTNNSAYEKISTFNQSFNQHNRTQSSNETNVPTGLPMHTLVISTIFYAITLVVGLVGNSLVIIVVGCNKSLQHNTNYCLVNLSVADLVLIIICMPSAIVRLFFC
jgi:hypothetical protein